MIIETMRDDFEGWHCSQYKTKHTTGAPTRDMHNGVRDQDYCSKKSQALWECWQKTGGDVAKVEALKDKIEKREEGQQPVGYLDRIPSGDYGFRSIKVSPHAYYKIPVYTRSDADVIRGMNDELADLRARLAERDALLQRVYDADLAARHYQPYNTSRLMDDIESILYASAEPGAPVERQRHIPRTDAVYDASWFSEKLPVPKCIDTIRPVDPGKEIIAIVESSLRRSFSLGQVYWQQADSDSTCQQNKSDQTMEVQAQHILNVVKSIKELIQ